jgi:cation diffusion facilitator family transporter
MAAPNSQHNGPYAQIAAAAEQGRRATFIGICASALLAIVKILAGVIGNAYALIADGVESVLDIFSSIVVIGSLRLSASEPNERFPFGYGRIEPLGALVVSLILIGAAITIAIESAREISVPRHAPAKFTLAVLLGVIVVKELMFRFLLKAGDEIGSTAVRSDAWHHRSDAITSAAAFIGISIALIGGPGYESADDWAAIAACFVIGFNGIRLFRSALLEVLDVAAPEEIEKKIRDIASSVPGVARVEKCRVRKSGLGYFIEIHVEVKGDMTVRDGHRIAHEVKDALMASELGVFDVAVHIEPAD